MPQVALIIFLLTYFGVALGRIPGLALDRTGIALLGGIATVAAGVLTEAEALRAVDYPTLLLLYGLMIVSAQFRLAGFYTAVAKSLSRGMGRPARFLFLVMIVSAFLAAVLTNDIICLAFTPLLTRPLLQCGLNPVPFLLGLAISTNLGSAATLIGNPQNMLIGQVGRLDFARFLAWCAPPSLLSLGAAYLVLCAAYRGRWHIPAVTTELPDESPELDRHQSKKAIIATICLLALFFTDIPRELSAMAVAGFLLCSRKMQTRWILDYVDWHLLTLFAGLFIVIRGLEVAGWVDRLLRELQGANLDVRNPYALTFIGVVLSNLASNVPATMLLVKFLDPATPTPWYVLALASTYAGNLIVLGSIANLIVIEQAKPYGVHISFREHARVGVPITLLSLFILLLWIRWQLG